MTGDIFIHNVLDRPRDRPVRTAVCVGALTFYLVVYVAGAQDVLAFYLNTTQPPVTLALRGLAIGLPVAAGVLTWRICRGLAETGRLPATEPPKGPHTSETPAAAKYLPSRARFEEADEVGELEHQ
jgi:hypothetical protein